MTHIGSPSETDVSELIDLTRDYDVSPIFLPQRWEGCELLSQCFDRLSSQVYEEVRNFSPEKLDGICCEMDPTLRLFCKNSAEVIDPKKVAEYYIISLIWSGFSNVRTIVSPNEFKDRVFLQYPELKSLTDQDGLLRIGGDIELRRSGVRYKNHILHFHGAIRREYFGYPNTNLIEALGRMASRDDRLCLRIAIDRTRLMPLSAYREHYLLDHWWGQSFSADRLNDPEFVGMAVVGRRKGTVLERMMRMSTPVERTEFFWAQDERDIKSLQIEEIRSPTGEIGDWFLHRYVHAQIDMRSRRFIHLDGAVKIYSKDEFNRRLEKKLSSRFRVSSKPKGFRIDGEIATEDAMLLIGMFYRGNEMVLEYFDKHTFDREFGKWNVPWVRPT